MLQEELDDGSSLSSKDSNSEDVVVRKIHSMSLRRLLREKNCFVLECVAHITFTLWFGHRGPGGCCLLGQDTRHI